MEGHRCVKCHINQPVYDGEYCNDCSIFSLPFAYSVFTYHHTELQQLNGDLIDESISESRNDTTIVGVRSSQFIEGVSDNTSDYYSNFAFQESCKNSQEEMLMVFNIRSIPRNLDCFVSEFSDVIQNNMNVICFTETWFNKDNVDVYKLCNYNGTHVFRTGKKGGGVSIFVRNSINYTRLNEFCYNENYLESVAIHIKLHEMNTAKNIILINMYRPPKAKLEQYMTTLEQMLEGISLRNEFIFIVGDFNIDLLNSGSDIHSTRLINLLLSYELKPMITCPTRVNKNKDTLLDNIFTNFNEHNRTGVILNNISDHYPIFLSLGTSCGTSQQPKETMVDIWNYNINTISKYSRHIEEIELMDNTDNSIQALYTIFNNNMAEAHKQSFSKLDRKVEYKNKLPWVNERIRLMIKQKNKLYIKWHNFRTQIKITRNIKR